MRSATEFRAYIELTLLPKVPALRAQRKRDLLSWPGWPIIAGVVGFILSIVLIVKAMGVGPGAGQGSQVLIALPFVCFFGGAFLAINWKKIFPPKAGPSFEELQKRE